MALVPPVNVIVFIICHQIVYGCDYNAKAALLIGEALLSGTSAGIRNLAGIHLHCFVIC